MEAIKKELTYSYVVDLTPIIEPRQLGAAMVLMKEGAYYEGYKLTAPRVLKSAL